MVSNRLTFAALGLACVTAAGVGGYLGTRHNVAEVPAAAAAATPVAQTAQAPSTQATPADVSAPQPAPVPELAPTEPSRPAEPSTRTTTSRAPHTAPIAPTAKSSPSVARPTDTPAAQTDAQTTVPDRTAPAGPATSAPGNDPAAPARTDDRAADMPRTAEPAEPSYDELVVAADSVIGLQTETSLTSERARVEDRVEARVVRDVRVGGRVAIPAGTRALGNVVVVERGGRLRDRARLGIRFNTLALPDGTRVPITTETIYRYGEAPSNGSAAKIGGGAVAGAILGAILGGGKGAAIGATTGAAGGGAAVMAGDRSEATLPAGMEVTARMLSPVTVTVEH